MEERNEQEVNADVDPDLTQRKEGYEPKLVDQTVPRTSRLKHPQEGSVIQRLTTYRPTVVKLKSSGTV